LKESKLKEKAKGNTLVNLCERKGLLKLKEREKDSILEMKERQVKELYEKNKTK
jgi:hypothetical protein